MGTMAYARQALLDAARYRDAWAAYEKAPRGRKRPRYDAALGRLAATCSPGGMPLVVTATRENDVRRALALADEFKVKVVGGGRPAGVRALAELVKARKLPLLVSVNFDPPRAASFFGGVDEEQERREIERGRAQPGRAAQGRACPSRSSRPTRPTSWPACARRSRGPAARGGAARGRRSARPRRSASPTGRAAWRPARSRTWWSGRASRCAKDTKAQDGVRGRPALRAGAEDKPDARQGRRTRRAASSDAPKSETSAKAATAVARRCRPRRRRAAAGKPVAITGGTILTVGPAGHDRERHAC